MSTAQATIFLSDEIFELLVQKVPNEVFNGLKIRNFAEAVGTSEERFKFIVEALRDGGRKQAFVGMETAGYLRNALALTLLELSDDFQTRTGYSHEEALAVLQQLIHRTAPAEVA